MTITYFPFDAGQGASVTESQWGMMAQLWRDTGVVNGVLNSLLLYADSTGMQCKVKSGQAWIQGYFFQSDAEVVLPIATADPTNPRMDRIVIRVDWTANTITLNVLQGTPAASPGAPALTQNSSRWEISLGYLYINAGASTIASSNVTDERFPTNFITPTFVNGWVANSQTTYPNKYWKNDDGMVHFRLAIMSGATGANNACMIFPAGYRPKETEMTIAHQDNTGTYESNLWTVNANGNLQNVRLLNSNSLIVLAGCFKAFN